MRKWTNEYNLLSYRLQLYNLKTNCLFSMQLEHGPASQRGSLEGQNRPGGEKSTII